VPVKERKWRTSSSILREDAGIVGSGPGDRETASGKDTKKGGIGNVLEALAEKEGRNPGRREGIAFKA